MSQNNDGRDKADRDNRANQLNPNNWRFEKAREDSLSEPSTDRKSESKQEERGK